LVAFATFIEAHRNHGHGKGKHDHDDDHDHHHHSHGNNKADVAISRASLGKKNNFFLKSFDII